MSGLFSDIDEEDIDAAVNQITMLAKAYTRGNGFAASLYSPFAVPNDEIAAVIVLAAARLVSNPRQIAVDIPSGAASTSFRGAFDGWTTAELAALNRYRRRAQ